MTFKKSFDLYSQMDLEILQIIQNRDDKAPLGQKMYCPQRAGLDKAIRRAQKS